MRHCCRNILYLLPLWLAAGVAAAGAPPTPDAVLATVGGQTITVAQFEAEMARRGGGLPGQYQTPEQRRALLDEMVHYRALVAAARAAGYDHDPEVLAVMQRMMVSRLQHDRVDKALDDVSVSDDEVAAYYSAHVADYSRPARYQAAIIFIEVPAAASDAARARARHRAEQAREEAQRLDPSIHHFGKVAVNYSDDRASRYQGGAIGWLVKHPGREYRWDKAVTDAIFALTEPGQIGPIIETEDGFYLVRLMNREGSQTRPLDVLADGIRHSLVHERRSQLRQSLEEGLVKGVATQINDAVLASVEPPSTAAPEPAEKTPPRMPAR